MRSTNPVLSKSDAFSAAPQQTQYPTQPYGAPGQYGQPGSWGAAPQQYPTQQYPTQPGQPAGVMTIDDVITKSAVTMGLLFLSAAATFLGFRLGIIPVGLLYPAMLVSGLVAFVAVMVVAVRRKINPAFVLGYSVLEGVFVGALSLLFESMFPGIVTQAVLATFVAAGVTLAAYKFFRIKVTGTFRKVVTISTMALAAAYLVNLVVSLFGGNLGLVSIGSPSPLAMLVSAVAVVLAVLNLILDFDYIEQGIRNRAPAAESWRAAFGLTVTMVWLYTEILRILSYFRSN